jgi:hypothetical protein
VIMVHSVKHSSLCCSNFNDKEKLLMTPEVNVIKLFMSGFMNFCNKLECFFPGEPFQPSLIFEDKVQSLEHLKSDSLWQARALPANKTGLIRLGWKS